MQKKKRQLVFVMSAMALTCFFCAIVCAVYLYNSSQLISDTRNRYKQVHESMTRNEVLVIMDTPHEIGAPHNARALYWDDEITSRNVPLVGASAYRWRIDTFYLPITFEVVFDEQGHVIGKHVHD